MDPRRICCSWQASRRPSAGTTARSHKRMDKQTTAQRTARLEAPAALPHRPRAARAAPATAAAPLAPPGRSRHGFRINQDPLRIGSEPHSVALRYSAGATEIKLGAVRRLTEAVKIIAVVLRGFDFRRERPVV